MLAPNNPEEEIKLQQYVKDNNLQYGEDAMENLRHGWMAKAAELREQATEGQIKAAQEVFEKWFCEELGLDMDSAESENIVSKMLQAAGFSRTPVACGVRTADGQLHYVSHICFRGTVQRGAKRLNQKFVLLYE